MNNAEQKNIPMTKFYLDWNIITNLRNPNKIEDKKLQNEFTILKELLENPKMGFIIPYSNAHLLDIKKNWDKGEKERVSESLLYLSQLTQNACLAQYWGNERAIWHSRDPVKFFNSILEDELNKPKSWQDLMAILREFGLDKIYEPFKSLPHNINFTEIEKKQPLFAHIFPKSSDSNTIYAIFEDIFDLYSKLFSDPLVYKELRKMIKDELELNSNINKIDNAIEELDKILPKTKINKSFTELTQLNNTKTSENEDYSRIIATYMQLDLVGYNSDKINNKNRYENIFKDSMHCFYAAHCDIYLTNDKKGYKKTKAVYKSERIKTQVYNTNEFIELLKNNNRQKNDNPKLH